MLVSAQDKQPVEDYMDTPKYDSLIDEDPEIQQRVAAAEARGKAEGKIEGEIRGLQWLIMEGVKDRFPALLELAQERVPLIRKPDLLYLLAKLIYKAPDETTARLALDM